MSKKSIIARQDKREKLVAKFAEKKGKAKSRRRLRGFGQIAPQRIAGSFAQSLQTDRTTSRICQIFRRFAY